MQTCHTNPLHRLWNDGERARSFTSQIGVPGGCHILLFVDAYNFIKYSKECSSPKVKEIAASLTEDSNHVMVIAHFKTNQKHRF